jgi:Tfp pilus assembly protein PilV
MLSRTKHLPDHGEAGFALGEVLVAFAVLTLVFSGLIYGYVQANRMAEWSSMSLAAQSYASQGAEQARAAKWSPQDNYSGPTGFGTADEWPAGTTVITNGIMDVPIKGSPTNSDFAFWVTNKVTVTQYGSGNPPLRQIWSDCYWTFPLTGAAQTNTVILIRGADQ